MIASAAMLQQSAGHGDARLGEQLGGSHMSADGTWKLAMKTPIGERKATLVLKDAGGALSGKMTNEEGNSTDIFEGKASGNGVSFKAAVKSPMPLTLEFSGSVDGDKIAGTVNASGVGSWPFSGTRG
jgi:hypothetical protein